MKRSKLRPLVLAVALATPVVLAQPAQADDCVTSPAGVTQTGGTIIGTEGNDYIDCSGAGHPHNIFGFGGNDRIIGSAFGDFIRGGTGNDHLDGRDGTDLMLGEEGNDVVLGGTGGDDLRGNEGSDYVDGGEGKDFLDGGIGQDSLRGGAGDDFLFGPANDGSRDFVDGGPQFDRCDGYPTGLPDRDVLVNCEDDIGD
jgi:Ca2+-binding RTX toxin-like protein